MRSSWKLNYFNLNLLNLNRKNKFFFRNSPIPKFLLKKKFFVHNGIWFKSKVLSDKFAIGLKFGEFSKTRRYTKGNKKSKRKNKAVSFKKKNLMLKSLKNIKKRLSKKNKRR